ncbi:PREDICTED: uncharacterized protein LOC105981022 [Dipodomys ordii]|uniref:Uncharacterized protein LOC105981022 n=1 Tax=Dipodomys ordii TaxID=10020 RepID=A0A1S3ENF6_DIPOR|nr:PREDICTED: uncharacterized protein LOC105981022 [Dipodomys ordii]
MGGGCASCFLCLPDGTCHRRPQGQGSLPAASTPVPADGHTLSGALPGSLSSLLDCPDRTLPVTGLPPFSQCPGLPERQAAGHLSRLQTYYPVFILHRLNGKTSVGPKQGRPAYTIPLGFRWCPPEGLRPFLISGEFLAWVWASPDEMPLPETVPPEIQAGRALIGSHCPMHILQRLLVVTVCEIIRPTPGAPGLVGVSLAGQATAAAPHGHERVASRLDEARGSRSFAVGDFPPSLLQT